MEYPKSLPDHPDTPWFLNGNKLMVQQFMFTDYCIGMHSHDYYEVNIVIAGKGAHYYAEHIFEVSEGDVFVIPPGIKHGYWSNGDLAVYHVIFHPSFFQKYETDLIELPGFFALFDVAPQIRKNAGISRFLKFRGYAFNELYDILERGARVSQRGDHTVHDYVGMNVNGLYLITRLTAFYEQAAGTEENAVNDESQLFAEAVDRISRDYDKKLDGNLLAKDLHVSRTTYYMLFRKYAGKTPCEYIVHFRINKAKTLLRMTNDSVTKIALATGFFDSPHFIRVFKRIVGVSPKEYRTDHTIP